MKNNRLPILGLVIFVVVFLFATTETIAQERSAGPIKRWVRVEGRGITNDYVVEFLIPKPRIWRIVASGDTENKVLAASTTETREEGKNLRVILTTGKRARVSNYMNKSIDAWANSLTIYYVMPK